jgi:hypothetical protein
MKKIEDVHIKPSFSMFRKVSIPKSRDFFNSRYEVLTLTVDGLEKGNFSLAPGDSLFFSFSTESLVGISNFYIQSFNDFPPVASLNATDEEHKEDIKTNSVSGHTLGPWLPDSSMSLIDFTDTLQTFRRRSCEELGWITNKGICNSLDVKLRNVERHLERNKPRQAGNVLNAFLNELNAQRGKHITEEGYALLYYNAEYLQQRIKEME